MQEFGYSVECSLKNELTTLKHTVKYYLFVEIF